MTIAVIAIAFFGIAQNFISLGGLLELVLGLLVADVAVGMKLHGQLAIRSFDFLSVGGFLDAENLVITALDSGHERLLVAQQNPVYRFAPVSDRETVNTQGGR
jgi:hypothetical protein